MRTLLLIVTLVSNFPLLIVGMGIILLLVLVVLFCRNRQKKVGIALESCINLLKRAQPTDISPQNR